MEKILTWLVTNWYSVISLLLSIMMALITTIMTNKLAYKRTLKLKNIESEVKQNMEDWIEIQNLIKDMANTVSYMIEIADIISKNKDLNSTKIYEYKKQMIDIFYTLNNKSLMYMSALKRIGINETNDPIYFKFYQEVFNRAYQIKKDLFEYLDSQGTKKVCIDFKDNGLLDSIICEADYHIKEFMKEV